MNEQTTIPLQRLSMPKASIDLFTKVEIDIDREEKVTKRLFALIIILLLASTVMLVAKEYNVPRAASSVFVCDLDLDGDIDIVVGHKTAWGENNPTISILWNDGKGNFDNIDSSFSFCGYQENILVVDLNNDNYPDLITFMADFSTGTSDYYVRVFYNNHGEFTDHKDFSLKTTEIISWAHINYSDIDSDGDIDIIVPSNRGRFVGILYNDGTGNFGEPKYYYYDTPVGNVVRGDLNNDGREDIAVAISTTKLALFYNMPTGLDTCLINYDETITYGMSNIRIADIDNDGINEIMGPYAGFAPKGLFIVLSKTNEKIYAVKYTKFVDERIANLFILDLDNDTYPDVIYNTSYSYPLSEYETYHTYILYNNKDGTFKDPVNYQTYFGDSIGYVQSTKSFAADLDNNSWKDIITVNYAYLESTINILFNDGKGNFLADPVVGIEKDTPLTNDFVLYQNYPNPFNNSTEITFQLPQTEEIDLTIYNIKGEVVKRLIKDKIELQGNHTIRWNGRNENGKEVSSGVFFYVLEGIHHRNVKKMILMK
jgi:hypothetical protein